MNPLRDASVVPSPAPTAPRKLLHQYLPLLVPTPLVDAPNLAAAWNVRRVLVKDESGRGGLGSFKVLGASWAVYRLLLAAAGLPPSTSYDDFRARALTFVDRRLVTATDGNHGRAVAFLARVFGMSADIFVPAGTAPARIDAIRGEGARVHVVDGDYDEACAAAAADLDERSWLVSDTSWPGHDDVPGWVVDGYSTLFAEIEDVVPAADIAVVVVPVGVGALAAAAVSHYCSNGRSRPALVGAEPVDAACVQHSLEAGAIASTPGPHRTVIAGLNCGTPSAVAWPVISRGLDATVTIGSADAECAMVRLAREGLRAGATGAASAAGMDVVLTDPEARAALGIDPDATVLVLDTEGPTDPDHYLSVTGECA